MAQLPQDRSGQEEYEKKLKSSVMEAALDAIVIMDSCGLVIEWNPAAERIFGYKHETAIGKEMAELIIPPHLREAHRRGLKKYLQTGVGPVLNRRIEISAMRSDGTEFPVELIIAPITAGLFQMFTGYIRDLTAQKLAEKNLKEVNEQLKRANIMKSDFTSIVSHELRTPLGVIKEGVDLVLDQVDGPINQEHQETLNVVKSNIDRLVRLVNNILDFSHIESGKLIVTFHKTNMNDLILKIQHLMKAVIHKKALDLSYEIPEEPVWADCDEDKMSQILINLIDNAAKYTDPHGSIKIRMSASGGFIQISVQDTGIGISPEDYQKIFEMYGQSHHPTTLKTGGVGVGLAICKKLIELHSGEIRVQSTLGHGSIFTVIFPQSGKLEPGVGSLTVL